MTAEAKHNKQGEQTDQKELSLVDHLIELRGRLLKCVAAVLLLFIGLFFFANEIYTYVALPLTEALPEGSSMISTDPTAPFLAPLKLTFYAALALAAPYILYQTWSFIAPGLYKDEKAVAIPLFISSVLLFYAGIAFARYVLFGVVFRFFISVAPEIIEVTPDISSFLSFALAIFFAFGLAFEIPIAVFLCVWAGIAEPDSLARKRPYVIVGCFVIAMLLTPPDVFSQLFLAVPMCLLFELGIFAGRLVRRRQQPSHPQQ